MKLNKILYPCDFSAAGEEALETATGLARDHGAKLVILHVKEPPEGGGCLAEAVSRCPALSDEARVIEAQHPALLSRLGVLRNQISAAEPTAECRVETLHEFDDLLRELHAHEAAENNVLRHGFGTNVVDDGTAIALTAMSRSHTGRRLPENDPRRGRHGKRQTSRQLTFVGKKGKLKCSAQSCS